MTAGRHAAWVLLLIPACFHPSYDHPACGPNRECPDGLTCSAQLICEGVGDEHLDASPDTPGVPADAQTCFGTGLLHICLQIAPTTPLTISTLTVIDTTSSSMCATVVSGGNYCVLAATTINIDTKLRATGIRPLVLIASDSITTTAQIDVGSHRNATPEIGAGADPVACLAGTAPSTANNTSGGGAGGSFRGLGGSGGAGGSAGGAPGIPGAATGAITELRGGCPGQDGQGGGAAKGVKGHGGGAVFLIAGNKIDVQGGINAAGEGGGPGQTGAAGGGGGGSGGMIGFDAPMILVSSLILANGGGGGEGSGTSTIGAPGADPSAIIAAAGGSGNNSTGGDGGNGSTGAPGGPGQNGAPGSTGGGGGGGGGAGLVKAPATATLGTQVSPAATP